MAEPIEQRANKSLLAPGDVVTGMVGDPPAAAEAEISFTGLRAARAEDEPDASASVDASIQGDATPDLRTYGLNDQVYGTAEDSRLQELSGYQEWHDSQIAAQGQGTEDVVPPHDGADDTSVDPAP